MEPSDLVLGGMTNQVLPTSFQSALALGQQNEQVIAHEFEYHGIPIQRTQGKHDFDFFLPDGRSVEVKLDLRSQATNYALFEEPTFNRAADIHIHTLTYAVVLTRQQVEELYKRGKVANAGDFRGHARLVPKYELKNAGVYLDQFIKSLNPN